MQDTAFDPVWFTFLNGSDIEQLELDDTEVLDAVEQGLRAQGRGETVIEPRVHLTPDPAFNGHFNVLRGYVAPLGLAGVKIVGDYVGNYKAGLPSEMALLNLFDPRTGMPVAVVDATAITEMRTGALTALGARHLARPGLQGARSHRRPRHLVLERPPARPDLRLRRDTCPLAPPGEP
jgi:alanine dehydrogenase